MALIDFSAQGCSVAIFEGLEELGQHRIHFLSWVDLVEEQFFNIRGG